MMNGNGVGILEGNIEFIPTTINPDDYEVLQARGFDITQIATFFGVP
jgi:phage portal protein BeeE